MKKEYIADCLADYAKSNCVRLHMPGHKGNGKGILSEVYAYDVTELSFSDNLADPSGIIAMAEEDIAKICGAKRSRILTGGSTLGVLSAIYAVKDRGKKLIIQRSSHKSVYNALELFGIQPLILNDCLKDGLITGEFSNDWLFDCADNDIIGALLTSPDYFGRALNLKDIKQRLNKNGKLLLVDGAHGGHFVFDNPSCYAGNFADIWVDGAHKTLQTLTQGAVLNVNDLSLMDGVQKALSIFSTSSPSYLIMASVESGFKNFEEFKNQNLQSFGEAKQILVGAIKDAGYEMLDGDDPLKVAFVCKNGQGNVISENLEKAGIYAELASDGVVLFMLGYSFNKEQALRVEKVLKDNIYSGEQGVFENPSLPIRKTDYISAVKGETELVDLSDAYGRVCAENAGVFPPCYPVITAGEVFDNRVIKALLVKNTFGIQQGKVKVVKE